MESELLKPRRIDFSECLENVERERVPVYLRIKPAEDEEMSIKILDDKTVETNHASRANKKATYTRVFRGSATQQEVFDGTSARLIRKFLNGANVMTFAYGATSSGKTYTIMGNPQDPGILPRTLGMTFESLRPTVESTTPIYKPSKFDGVEQISIEEMDQLKNCRCVLTSKVKGSDNAFDKYSFSNTASGVSSPSKQDEGSAFPSDAACSVWISIYEIHNEVITDLLSAEPKSKRRALTIGQDSDNRTFIKDLVQLPVESASQAYALLQFARQDLETASTKLNDNSSRSHMVFNLKMVRWGAPTAKPFVNHLVISDLAGSERQAKTGTSGQALKQAGAINTSLLVLGRCVEALRKKDKALAAPFRDSKLTRILNPFFTLGGYVSLIICINPNINLQDETLDTVRFSAIACEIVQDPIKLLDNLHQLSRLALGSAESRPKEIRDVVRWQDAVNGVKLYGGVAYLEVMATYFDDMARDILRAERQLLEYEAKIEFLSKRLKDSEVSKENVKLMYEDKMRAQRVEFADRRLQLEKVYKDIQKTLVEEFEEDIRTYKEKYLKYRDGYAKLSGYIKDKLWPEVELFRERFGCLPEFPPKDGNHDEEVEPKNTIKYWQDKLHEKEIEYGSLRTQFSNQTEETAFLAQELNEHKELLLRAEAECQHCRREVVELASRVNELNEELASVKNRPSDHETLAHPVSGGNGRPVSPQHQVELDPVIGNLGGQNDTIRERTPIVSPIKITDPLPVEMVAGLESQEQFCGSEGRRQLTEETELLQRIIELQAELSKRHEEFLKQQERILWLQDEVERLTKSEAELRMRELQTAFKLRDVHRTRAAVNDIARLGDDLERLRAALDEEKKASASKDVLVASQEVELEALRARVTTIGFLGRQMQIFSGENKGNQERLKVLQKRNRRPRAGIKRDREFEVEVEFFSKKSEYKLRRILRDCPPTEKAIQRGCSVSSTGVEHKLQRTTQRFVRDSCSAPTPYRTRSSTKR